MPMFEFAVAMMTSQQPSSAALPAKQTPGVDPDKRDAPAQAAQGGPGRGVQRPARPAVAAADGLAALAAPAGAGASAAALGEEEDGELPLLRQREHAVRLRMVDRALRPGQDRVVVRHDDAARPVRAEERLVHRADTGDHAVGREPADYLLHWQAGSGRQDETAVFDERARVAEVVDVLARRALAGLPPPLHGVGPGGVEGHGLAFEYLREVGPDVGRVDCGLFFALAVSTACSSMYASGWPS